MKDRKKPAKFLLPHGMPSDDREFAFSSRVPPKALKIKAPYKAWHYQVMTFEEILDQAIAMLQRRGRVTYGALKRQFQLDDAYLEDVKAELIEGQRVAVDEDGRVLVWTDAPTLAPSATAASAETPTRAPRAYTPAYLA